MGGAENPEAAAAIISLIQNVELVGIALAVGGLTYLLAMRISKGSRPHEYQKRIKGWDLNRYKQKGPTGKS